jgi:hypothetical protein
MSIVIGNLKACRVARGERYSPVNNVSADRLPTYLELVKAGDCDVAIPAMQNRLVIIDIDAPRERTRMVNGVKETYMTPDGRIWWRGFAQANNIPNTYTIISKSGGFHLYFELPSSIDHLTFKPKSIFRDANNQPVGVEVKYRATVHAPPTKGYQVHPQSPLTPSVVPIALMEELLRGKTEQDLTPEEMLMSGTHSAFSAAQVDWLRKNIPWVQENCSLSRENWRDGIFSIKAGTQYEPELGEELSIMWTMNQGYSDGDEVQAVDMYHKADAVGDIQGGTIIHLIRTFFEEKGVPLSLSEVMGGEIGISILEKAGVTFNLTKHGKPQFIDNETNAALILDTLIPKQEMFLNTRTDTFMYKGKQMSDKDLMNHVLPMLQKVGGGLGFEKMKKSTVQTGIEIAMHMRSIDPHEEWLKQQVWDGVPRIERFFIDVMGGADNEYNRILGKNLFSSLAARSLSKGCKFDAMYILEGEEGARKSTLISILGRGAYYSVRGRNILTADDSLRQMHQAVTVEFPELIGLRHEDPEIAKAFVTSSVDKMRGLYERKAVDRARGFIMFGSTNKDEYLSLDMGRRRWWPFKVPKGFVIDTDYVEKNLGLFYAEGKAMWEQGYSFWYMPEELLNTIQASKQTGSYLREEIKKIVLRKGLFDIKEIFDELTTTRVIGSGGLSTWGKEVESEVRRLGCVRDSESNMWKMPGVTMPLPQENNVLLLQGMSL